MKNTLISLLKALRLYDVPSVPRHISKNFKSLNEADEKQLRSITHKNCFPDWDIENKDTQVLIDLQVRNRLSNFRARHIVFLDAMVGLKGKKVIEIGCGTASSTIALAEQGAKVWGIDVDPASLLVAEERRMFYGFTAEDIVFKNVNATDIDQVYEEGFFDIVIFFAAVEHMTYAERLRSFKAAWKVLKKGGAFCILGTPNRLWFFDMHTSQLPFYMWLPDDLAFQYSSFSSRQDFKDLYKNEYNDKAKLNFNRWGRGVSYHEIDLALQPANQLKVLGDLHSFERPDTFLQKWFYSRSDEYHFKKVLAKAGPPGLAPGFYEYYLDVAIAKP